MNLSYWEYKTWLTNIDFTIVGSGIVGLNCALSLQRKYPKAKIMVLEKGILPQGASTKNAGFACFGSISEILSDLKQHTEDEVAALVHKRWEGIQLMRKNLGDHNIDFQQHGGHELFLKNQKNLFQNCLEQIDYVNNLLRHIYGSNPFGPRKNEFGFNGIEDTYITNSFEAQIDTGKMMAHLVKLVKEKGITILNAIAVVEFAENGNGVSVKTDHFEFRTKKLLIATNGFASQLLNEPVKPARAQVLITKPIKNLHIKGTFHLDEGYYYFRNIDDRILFGGGRNLDFQGEETTIFGETKLIQNQLEVMLEEMILPHTEFEIDYRWSGIMGIGAQKSPILKQVSSNVFCGVRLGGMGIAIGSLVGKELADLI
ncbi:MAG: NAD(P)/FAD-dependent oxidoreductase [Flavobacteriaceae bacterium]